MFFTRSFDYFKFPNKSLWTDASGFCVAFEQKLFHINEIVEEQKTVKIHYNWCLFALWSRSVNKMFSKCSVNDILVSFNSFCKTIRPLQVT